MTDGTRAGTRMLQGVIPGAAGSGIFQLVPAGSTAYFPADDGVHGNELWATDGTPAGTRLVLDIAT